MATPSVFGLDSSTPRALIRSAPRCPKCTARIPEDKLNQPDLMSCTRCQSLLQVEVFPALFRRAAPAETGEIALIEGESTCFYHAGKKAVLPCHNCGRFVCALCDCELNGEHFCPACLETGKTKGRIKNLENRRTPYDSIALSLVVLPVVTIIFWFCTFITAPLALYVAIRYWNAPRSVVHPTKIRFVLAIIIATIEIATWAIFIYLAVTDFNG